MDVGKRIRQAREQAGLSQSALARKAKVGRITLVRIESSAQEPTLATLSRLATALHISLEKLFGGKP